MTRASFTDQVISTYLSLPDTPCRASRYDRILARDLHQKDVSLTTIKHAMLLATVRRHFRDLHLPPLEPIHSLHYFVPIIHFLQAQPLDSLYVDYLQRKMAQIANSQPIQI